MVTPYLIPGNSGVRLLSGLRSRGVRVRILTNSLESSPEPEAHSGYMHYRVPLLQDGVELYEVRASLGSARGSGEPDSVARATDYALHAKLFVFDRRQLYVGSMNFDERSHHLNTEIGLIIDSPELARQMASRFDAITAPENSYQVRWIAGNAGGPAHLAWLTREGGEAIEYDREPARNEWQRIKVDMLSLLPLDREL
jgi:putative cardiolipin synthase